MNSVGNGFLKMQKHSNWFQSGRDMIVSLKFGKFDLEDSLRFGKFIRRQYLLLSFGTLPEKCIINTKKNNN